MSDEDIIDVEEPKKPSLIGKLVVPLILILIAGGAGFGFAKGYVEPMLSKDTMVIKDDMTMPKKILASDDKDVEEMKEEAMDGEPSMKSIVPLGAVVTNLAEPSDVWIRAEFSLMFTEPPESGLPEQIQSDIVTHLRTVKLQNLEGSSGFQHLIADLNDLAMLRSDNKVSRVLVRAFLVE